MSELYDTLVKLGPGWMVFIMLGTIGGAISYIVGNRRYHRMMVEGHSEQLKLKDETIAMLKSSRDEATAIVTKSKDEATKERDMYRDRLHEEKANHQATLNRLTLSEARPDLGKIVEVNDKMLQALEKLDKKMDDTTNSRACQKTVQMVEALIRYLIKSKVLPEGFEP